MKWCTMALRACMMPSCHSSRESTLEKLLSKCDDLLETLTKDIIPILDTCNNIE